jgi:hypothetical protein
MTIFKHNKYASTYFSLMEKAQGRENLNGYFEKHHIIPKSLGGTNLASNIVKLTAREHFIAHLLLSKSLVSVSDSKKMGSALNRMLSNKNGKRYQPTSKMYEIGRKAHAVAMTGRIVTATTREKISKIHSGKITSTDAKEKMSLAKLGRPGTPRTKEWCENLSKALTGKKASEDTKVKLSKAKRGKPGVPRTPEWAAKIGAANKLRWEARRAASKL